MLNCVTRGDPNPRLLASWKEKDARIDVFSPDWKALVSSGAEGYRLRDAVTGRVLAVLDKRPYQIVGATFHGATFSPDSRLLFALASSARYEQFWVLDLKVWEVATGKEKATFPYVADNLNRFTDYFSLSGDGKILAFVENSERLPVEVKTSRKGLDGFEQPTAAYNATDGLPRVKLWDVCGWKKLKTINGGASGVLTGRQDSAYWPTRLARSDGQGLGHSHGEETNPVR